MERGGVVGGGGGRVCCQRVSVGIEDLDLVVTLMVGQEGACCQLSEVERGLSAVRGCVVRGWVVRGCVIKGYVIRGCVVFSEVERVLSDKDSRVPKVYIRAVYRDNNSTVQHSTISTVLTRRQ